MEERLLAVTARFRPGLRDLDPTPRARGIYDVLGTLFAVPLAAAGLVWLVLSTDLKVVQTQWPLLLLFLGLVFLFKEVGFFFLIEAEPGIYSDFSSSFEPLITWSATLILGPTAIWLAVLGDVVASVRSWRGRAPTETQHWSVLRNGATNLAETTLVCLIALSAYRQVGGAFPLPGLALHQVAPAILAAVIRFLLALVLYVPALAVVVVLRRDSEGVRMRRIWARVLATGLGGTLGGALLLRLYATMGAGLHAELGLGVYLAFIAGLWVVALLANRLSQEVERSQQRSRELAMLEELGRAILAAPPDSSTLPQVLDKHVPGMFSRSQIEVRLEDSSVLAHEVILHHPGSWEPVDQSAWEWLRANPGSYHFPPGTTLPWGGQLDPETALLLEPIPDAEDSSVRGGVYVARHWDARAISRLAPAVQSLAAQIASALHRAEVYRIERELAVAGEIQASFLPETTPQVTGYQLAARLRPARETSGDFYDFIPLPEGRLGLLIADVADKGTGAALFMAVSRTLIRTSTLDDADHPELALAAANRRILADTRAGLFVTVFYAVLDPASGRLVYVNAGHNPPLLLRSRAGGGVETLTRTGMALGVLEEAVWEQRATDLGPADRLVFYTDGVTDAESEGGAFFGNERLLAAADANRMGSAEEMIEGILRAVDAFTARAPQSDDITMMILGREP